VERGYIIKQENLPLTPKSGVKILRKMVDLGANVNLIDNAGRSVLYNFLYDSSSKDPLVDEIEFLLQNGADKNSLTEIGSIYYGEEDKLKLCDEVQEILSRY
jgi:hypothetical protein